MGPFTNSTSKLRVGRRTHAVASATVEAAMMVVDAAFEWIQSSACGAAAAAVGAARWRVRVRAPCSRGRARPRPAQGTRLTHTAL